MLDRLYFTDGHLTPAAFAALDEGILSDEDRELFLAHLENCASCMDRYIELLTDDVLTAPPDGLEDRIMEAVRAEQQQVEPSRERKILAIKIAKLAIAVCLTMVLFFGGVFDFIGNTSKGFAQNNTQIKIEQELEQNKQHSEREEGRFSNWMTDFQKGFNQFAKKFAFSF